MSKPNGGPAFPRPVSEDRTSGDQPDGNSTVDEQDGMSLRDYFAAHALAGILADHEVEAGPHESVQGFRASIARVAYAFADAMIVARGE